MVRRVRRAQPEPAADPGRSDLGQPAGSGLGHELHLERTSPVDLPTGTPWRPLQPEPAAKLDHKSHGPMASERACLVSVRPQARPAAYDRAVRRHLRGPGRHPDLRAPLSIFRAPGNTAL